MNILITGGAGSGKSTYALQCLRGLPGPRYYAACMKPADAAEWAAVARNRRERQGMGITTIETYHCAGLLAIEPGASLVLECLCNLLANEMFGGRNADVQAADRIEESLLRLAATCGDLLVVTNEIGGDGVAYDEDTMAYIQALTRLNRRLAQAFDQVWELVCGIPCLRKGNEVKA
ncbi:MAG: bifunctional adenosylcobinamide kinase/adenosylcobinamide-phosphate guanylyltransferase [Firmicutes bacterium]|nr:bifunctional adenosylcobinamide kinase/adenosylcobinamide-phosphate guanylyltransferase [Bacillota bacterium]